MSVKFANSAFATLASSINSSATSITLTTGQGARFPSLSAGDYFYATLIDTSNNLEIVKCTARSSDVLTVTRGQESTTARSYSAGDRIELRITAAGINEAVGILDGDRGDITVSDNGLTWVIDNLAVTDAKINTMAATKLTGTVDKARLPAGSVLQVLQSDLTTAVVFSSGSVDQDTYYTSGLSVTITPRSSSSKFLCLAQLSAGGSADAFHFTCGLFRDGSIVGGGTSGASTQSASTHWRSITSNHTAEVSIMYLDSPATASAVTYDIRVNNNGGSTYPVYLNRSGGDGNWHGNAASHLIIMEIQG